MVVIIIEYSLFSACLGLLATVPPHMVNASSVRSQSVQKSQIGSPGGARGGAHLAFEWASPYCLFIAHGEAMLHYRKGVGSDWVI